MTRATVNKLYRNFVKGMVTEASPLTYPENATISESNCALFKQGNRARRLGMDYEDSYVISDFAITQDQFNDSAFKEYRWEAVNNDSSIDFLVNQIGSVLYFYHFVSEHIGFALSPFRKSFTIDLTTYALSGYAATVNQYEVQMIGGKGYLFVVGEKIEPFYVTYDPDLDTITSTKITIQIRDFKGIDDGLANDEEPTVLSDAHKYNLFNQGWIDSFNDGTGDTVTTYGDFGSAISYKIPTPGPITKYHTDLSRYPGNNKQWWLGKITVGDPTAVPPTEAGDFSPALLNKVFAGNMHAPRGHFVVDAFNIDRTAVSGILALDVEAVTDRPMAVTFFSGRAWYGCNNTLYFSQLVDDKRRVGLCYQEADPTSEEISDLIATDGGVIPIPEMHRIRFMLPIGFGILCFAENGIWYVSGTTAGFSATDLSVTKVSNIGTNSPNSIVEAENIVYWWSKTGIQALGQKSGAFGIQEGKFDKANLTETTIQSFYRSEISELSKPFAKGIYDPATNIIQWLYKTGGPNNFVYNAVLNFDIALGAFYPWNISSNVNRPYILGAFLSPKDVLPYRSTFIKYLIGIPNADHSSYTFTFGSFKNTAFSEWAAFDGGDGFPYTTYIETGYELLDDAMRDKQMSYVFLYFRRTEQNFVEQTGGDYVFDTPSSCKFQVKWDWSSSQIANKWSTKIEAYRFSRFNAVDPSDLSFDTGFPVVVTKNKVRGNGKSIQFRFENSDKGSDFDLLGWAVPYSGNTKP
jgi:hypothetical protein